MSSKIIITITVLAVLLAIVQAMNQTDGALTDRKYKAASYLYEMD